jgi:hypothetical protein
MFGLGAKLRWDAPDKWAAAMMRSSEPSSPPIDAAIAEPVTPVHWTIASDDRWQWYEREQFVAGQWQLTGTTTPVDRTTGERRAAHVDYLADSFVPPEMKFAHQHRQQPTAQRIFDLANHQPNSERKGRHGRPPSEWLRSLYADELRIWLRTVEVPSAGVVGMTVWTHLTRDHSFDPLHIAGLTEPEQQKLHSAAHFGY